MILFWICVVIYIFLFVLGAKIFAKKDGYFSTFTVFGFTGFFYYLAVPMECAITGNDSIIIGEIGNNPLTDSTKIAISIMAVLALIGFGYGLKISNFTHTIKFPERHRSQVTQPVGILVFLFLALSFVYMFFRDQIVSSGTYEGNVETVYKNPTYTYFVDLIIIYSAILGGAIIIKKRRITVKSILYCMPGFYWGVYASTKDQIVISALALLTFFTVVRPPKSLFKIFFGFFVVLILAPLGMLWFTLYRAGVVVSWEGLNKFLKNGIFRNSDPAGPIAVFNDIYNSLKEFKFGSTYLDTFYLWIPKFIWPGRPPDIGERYAQVTLKYWLPGQGLGFSLLIEGYLNFSYLGVILQYFLIGFLWGKTWAYFKLFFMKISIHLWLSLYAIYGFLLLILIHRSPFSATPKQLLLTISPMIIFLLFFNQPRKLTI